MSAVLVLSFAVSALMQAVAGWYVGAAVDGVTAAAIFYVTVSEQV